MVLGVVGNPKPRSRTFRLAELVVQRVAEATSDSEVMVWDLADWGGRLLDWKHPENSNAVATAQGCRWLIVASPTYKASYTGMLKCFLDLFPYRGLASVRAIPMMVGAAMDHQLAVDCHLRPVLLELGASCPTQGLYVSEAELEEDAEKAVARWWEANRQWVST
ncbi:MAG: NAD(P)H-dependent oxidoreductase [Firmicutes bacterium]|nr:NAD(P)H-dependent oxidoreductase [Bacillota bacterium]